LRHTPEDNVGKKSDRKAAKRAAGKQSKLPKRIGGIKLDKQTRRSGERLLAAAISPIGREVIATGLAAIGAAMAARRPGPTPGPAATGTAQPIDPEEAGAQAARQFAALIGGAASAAIARYRDEIAKNDRG